MKFILASSSPRRRELLGAIGLTFEVIPSDVEEKRAPDESPEQYVTRLSREKGEQIARRHPDAWVIAADTIVYWNGEVLEKPLDREDAMRMLRSICGDEHTVFTGVTLLRGDPHHLDTRVVRTTVRMLPLSDREIAWYAGTGEPMDKAGAYAVQGTGAMFIESIDGNYTNVVGLPLATLFEMMRRAGIDLLTATGEPRMSQNRQ